MSIEPGMVVRVKPDKAYNDAVLATMDCTGEQLCKDGNIPQGCQDTGHLLMVVEQRNDGWALCPLSRFPHASGKEVPTPEYIKLGEADIIKYPTYLHVGLLTVVDAKFIYPRPHPKDAKAKASFRGERLKLLLDKVLGYWGKKGQTPSEGSLKSHKA
ncbi:MAG: hypothetical protein HS108_04325 [Planctomycetes bacterium]|jgi:hypothetical protein|nr:hypothetical protein [Planctomycetota bacterium]